MSKNGFMKERTLDKLREESSTIYQGTRLIVFLNALFAITCIIMLVLSFVFSSTVTGDAQLIRRIGAFHLSSTHLPIS